MVAAYLCTYGTMTFPSILESQTKYLCKLNEPKPSGNALAVIPLTIWGGVAFSWQELLFHLDSGSGISLLPGNQSL